MNLDLDKRDIMWIRESMRAFVDRFETDIDFLKNCKYPFVPGTYEAELAECKNLLERIEAAS